MSNQRPKGTNQGKALSPSDQEAIRQLFSVYGNKREVARRMGTCEKTVSNVLGTISNPKYDVVRAEAALEMAGRVQGVVHKAIEKIDDAKLERASFPQAMIGIGIGIDKIERLQQRAHELVNADAGAAQMLTPQSIAALVSSIKGRVNQLTILGLKIEHQAPDLSDRLEEALKVAEITIDNASIEEPVEQLDFYNEEPINADGLPDSDTPVD